MTLPIKAAKDDWETPAHVVNTIASKLGVQFTLDAAADAGNSKCAYHNSAAEPNKRPWANENVWCNPPYSDKEAFAGKAFKREANTCVMLLPASPDTKWFRRCFDMADSVYLKEGRIAFSGKKGNTTGSVFFVFHKERRAEKTVQYLEFDI